jgi:hypothetical protein
MKRIPPKGAAAAATKPAAKPAVAKAATAAAKPAATKAAPAAKPPAAKAGTVTKMPTPAAKPAATKAPATKPAVTTTAIVKSETKVALPQLSETLADIGHYEPGETPLPEGGGGVAWIGFFQPKAGRAGEIVKALGSITDGTPYMRIAGGYVLVGGFAWVVLAQKRYWCALDDKSSLIAVWQHDQGFNTQVRVEGKIRKVKDAVTAILLLLPGQQPLPEELAPATITVCDFRGTKAPAVLQHLKAVETAMTPEWAAENGDLASSVPPRFRVCSQFRVKAVTPRGGNAYSLAEAHTLPASLAQIEAVQEWHQNEDLQEEFSRAQEIFTQRVSKLMDMALDKDGAEEAPAAEPEEVAEEIVDEAAAS